MTIELHLAGQPEADALLSRDPFALLVGMLLDQQVPMERAFIGPYVIAARMGTAGLDPRQVAALAPDEFAAILTAKPAVHRYPGAMAERIYRLARMVVDDYDGDAAAIWTGVDNGRELLTRLTRLPGYGDRKARILIALLGKQLGVRPAGWREAAGDFGEPDVHRSAADVVDEASLHAVRAHKQQLKRAARS